MTSGPKSAVTGMITNAGPGERRHPREVRAARCPHVRRVQGVETVRHGVAHPFERPDVELGVRDARAHAPRLQVTDDRQGEHEDRASRGRPRTPRAHAWTDHERGSTRLRPRRDRSEHRSQTSRTPPVARASAEDRRSFRGDRDPAGYQSDGSLARVSRSTMSSHTVPINPTARVPSPPIASAVRAPASATIGPAIAVALSCAPTVRPE